MLISHVYIYDINNTLSLSLRLSDRVRFKDNQVSFQFQKEINNIRTDHVKRSNAWVSRTIICHFQSSIPKIKNESTIGLNSMVSKFIQSKLGMCVCVCVCQR